MDRGANVDTLTEAPVRDGGAQGASRPVGALVDAHVHLHEGFPLEAFVRAASRNLAAERRRGARGSLPGLLLMAESRGARGFERLAAHRGPGIAVTPTAEAVSLTVTVDGEPPIHVVSGRQVVTRERLEVLALGTSSGFEDGEDAAATLDRVTASGAMAVLPWGFGKWTGARGRRVRELFGDKARFPLLLAGDNGGRPGALPRPPLLAEAERIGRIVIPGTDPLPLAGEIGKAGRFGFLAHCAIDPQRPFHSLRQWLLGQTVSPAPFGELERLTVFLACQVALRRRQGG